MAEWKNSACILCECNCGIKVQTGGQDGREIVRIHGDEAHPASQGYLCQKASGLNFYQNGKDRLTSPLRRRDDGSFEAIDWNTAISEIAARLAAVKQQHGGDKIFYYGGGGQGNHLPGAYSTATRKALGSSYRSNALAQEKTGEFWVNGQMFGTHVKGDFEHCEVALFVGKNPWHSHGIPRARAWLREFSKNTDKTMIVIDPVVSETAKLADIHLRVKPGTDAWLMTAILAVLVEEQLYKQDWLAAHTSGLPRVLEALQSVPITEYCEACAVPEQQVREAARVMAGATGGVAVFEDLGIQMNRHSTLVSYLEKLVWLLCGQFGEPGSQYVPAYLQNLAGSGRSSRKSPVVGAPIISGLVPCNVIAEEILSDHEDRYRAMIIEAANPVHSLAGSAQFAKALDSLDTVVVIDIAMTETARHADYVLPCANQYEKWEATFFNFEFPRNYFHLRQPLFSPPENCLTEAEIHARLCEALGAIPEGICDQLNSVLAEQGRDAFRDQFMNALSANRELADVAPIVLYRTLGQTLPGNAALAAVLWPLALNFAMREPESLQRAGFSGNTLEQADKLFDAMLSSPSGFVFAHDQYEDSWARVPLDKINLLIPELLQELAELPSQPQAITSQEFPFVLMAGERRDYSANTIFRDASWRRKDAQGALRINPQDASDLGLDKQAQVRIVTRAGSAVTSVEITERMQSGHVSLPNGFGLDNVDGQRTGVAPNELTSVEDRDAYAGTPWHKTVPARLEAC